jgi:hypothetical protein
MNKFFIKDLDNSGIKFTMYQGWDGDVSLTMMDKSGRTYNVRVPMGLNAGDPNENMEDIKYLKSALRDLMMEFKYQSGEISKKEILAWRNSYKVRPFEEKWYE